MPLAAVVAAVLLLCAINNSASAADDDGDITHKPSPHATDLAAAYARSATLLSDGTYKLYWTVTDEHLELAIDAKTTGLMTLTNQLTYQPKNCRSTNGHHRLLSSFTGSLTAKLSHTLMCYLVGITGWVGFGIAQPGMSTMALADIVTAHVNDANGSVEAVDRFSTGETTPQPDCKQDWEVVSGRQVGRRTPYT
jgi:hypothetical protein